MTPAHAMATESLPWHHRDPFDRMLIAQTKQEGLTLLTTVHDKKM
jgi:PIN domain nuclease of toxin-antitoxin system